MEHYGLLLRKLREQEGMSLEYQARQAARYAADKGLHIIKVYSSAESAFKEGRKNFNQMLNDAVQNFPRHYASCTLPEKAEYIKVMVQRILITEKSARIVWKQPFSWIIEPVLIGKCMHSLDGELRTLCADILLKWVA